MATGAAARRCPCAPLPASRSSCSARGEKIDEIEEFHPERVAGRILGMGDVVSLVEKAAATIDAEQAEKVAQKMRKGEFDLEDLAGQLGQMQKLGGMSSILGMLPGIGKMKKQIDAAGVDDSVFKQQMAIISSMTPKERRHPKILAASRKKRIAAGSGTSVQDVNKLLKMHRQMADMMKQVSKGKGGLAKMFGLGGGAGMPEVTPEMVEAAKSGKMPQGMPQLPPGMGGMPGGLPGGMPGLPGGGMPKGFPGGLPGLPGRRSKSVTRILINAMCITLVTCSVSHAGDNDVYTLYRGSAVRNSEMRIHIATFDATDGENYNKTNCFIAAGLFENQPGVSVRYWCEKGRFKD